MKIEVKLNSPAKQKLVSLLKEGYELDGYVLKKGDKVSTISTGGRVLSHGKNSGIVKPREAP